MAWPAAAGPGIRDEVPLARPYARPANQANPLDMLRITFPGWDLGRAGGAYWAFPLDDPEALVWGMTPGSLAFAIRTAGGAS